MCARAEQKLSRQTERERERERGVRVLGKQDLVLVQQYRRFSETKYGLGTFFREKLKKGSAMLLSWQHCASPFLNGKKIFHPALLRGKEWCGHHVLKSRIQRFWVTVSGRRRLLWHFTGLTRAEMGCAAFLQPAPGCGREGCCG